MNREEALTLLNAKLENYRKASYTDLAAKIGHEEFPEVVGPSRTEYQIEIQVIWDHN
jgi:hypothetical protein